MSDGLNDNHSIYGIHIEGNQGYIDPLGFLHPDSSFSKPTHRMPSRNILNLSHLVQNIKTELLTPKFY